MHATKTCNEWQFIFTSIMSYSCFVCKYDQFPLPLSLSWSFVEPWGYFKLLSLRTVLVPLIRMEFRQHRVHGLFLQKAFLQWRGMIKRNGTSGWIQLFVVAFAGTRAVMRHGLVHNGAGYDLAVFCAESLCSDENPARRSHLFLVLGIAIGESPGP